MPSRRGDSKFLQRRGTVATLLLAAALATPPALAGPQAAASAPSVFDGVRGDLPKHHLRIVEKRQLSMLLSQGGAVGDATEQVFNNGHTYIVFRDPSDRMLLGWTAHMVLAFTSFAAFEEAAAQGIPARFEAVLYDNEAWPLTPAVERAHPHRYARRFKRLAHQNHEIFIAAPSLDGYGEGSLFFGDAREADVLDLQDQPWESSPALFSDRLRRAVGWARSHNHGLRVVVEISSNPARDCPGQPTCSQRQLRRTVGDAVQNQSVIDGFWLWIFDSAVGEADGAYMVELIARKIRDGLLF
jgi:hypothetical protein